MRRLSLVLLLAALSTHAHGAALVVDILADDADAHDADPGDGVCSDSGGFCTLRAAIEEANALPGTDLILFDAELQAGTLMVAQSEGPLPRVTDRTFINASTMNAYEIGATDVKDAPPTVFLDGSQLTSASARGLHFDYAGGTLAGGEIVALGIVNFPDAGIRLSGDADGITVDRNYIGVLANGTAAGNGRIGGGDGVFAFDTTDHEIGQQRSGGAFAGLGNVISANDGRGIQLFQSHRTRVAGNRIGTSPNGNSARGNQLRGVVSVSSDEIYVGDINGAPTSGNLVAANGEGGILLRASTGSFVFGNRLAQGENGNGMFSPGVGIFVAGTGNFIGGEDQRANSVFDHEDAAIQLGDETFPGSLSFVRHNEIGRGAPGFPLLQEGSGEGIVVRGDSNGIADNRVVLSEGDGINVVGDGNSLAGNYVGFEPTLVGGPAATPNARGITVFGDGNTIGNVPNNPNVVGGNTVANLVVDGNDNIVAENLIGVDETFAAIGGSVTGLVATGSGHQITNNVIGGSGNDGARLFTLRDSTFAGNFVGVAPDGTNISNGADGISVAISSSMLDITGNSIANNASDGVDIFRSSQITVADNEMYGNGEQAIDLENNGPLPNDTGDSDDGANRRLNYPDIEVAVFDPTVSPPQLRINARVDTLVQHAAYPLRVHLYWTDRNEPAQGRFVLESFEYDTPGSQLAVTLTLPLGATFGIVTANTVDADGNASEMSPGLQFGESDVIFSDDFESP